MKKYIAHTFRPLLSLIILTALFHVVSAQSSLLFKDAAGRMVEFTNFGTIVYPDQSVVSRGYEVVYNDGSILKRAWYLNSSFNSGIIPVSLSADRPNGHILSNGETVYVRARMKTADDQLEIICRYLLQGGAPGIDVVMTVINNSNSSIEVGEFSLLTPIPYDCQCTCEPARAFDGSTVQSTVITITPNTSYLKTKVIFVEPALMKDKPRDIPGCDRKHPIDFIPIR